MSSWMRASSAAISMVMLARMAISLRAVPEAAKTG